MMLRPGRRIVVWLFLLAFAGSSVSVWATATGLPVTVSFEADEAALPTRSADDAFAVEEQYGAFRFRCPDRGPQTAQPNPSDPRIYYGCPILVEDTADFFGNLDLAIHPRDPTKIAFFSLHGEPVADGPTSRSRANSNSGTHTTFTSANAGSTWSDQWVRTGAARYGEEAAGIMDSDGLIYLGYLWSVPQGADDHHSVLNLYKAGNVDAPDSVFAAYGDPWTYEGRNEEPVRIERLGLTRVMPVERDPGPTPTPTNASDPNGTQPADPHEVGEAAVTGNLSVELLLATWHTEAVDPGNSSTGMGRWIDAAWTGTGSENEWRLLWDEELIGPCMSASKPVAYRGKAYVACSVDRGYNHTPRARVGDIHVWSIDPDTGKTELMGDTRIRGLNPLLAVTPDGYFVVAAYDHTPPHDVSVQTSYGWYAKHWSYGRLTAPIDFGPELHRYAGYRPVLDAHVTNLVVTEREKTAFLIYSEWQEPEGAAEGGGAGSTPMDGDIQKVLYAFSECNPAIGALQLTHTAHTVRIGGTSSAASAARATVPPGAFNDAHDGMVYFHDQRTDEELVYFAVNDHGLAQYAAIVVGATGSACPPMPPPPIAPAIPVPAAISTGTGTMIAAGSTVGAVSSLMIGYLLTVKRRTAQYTSVEDN